jgi:hypothetical protein
LSASTPIFSSCSAASWPVALGLTGRGTDMGAARGARDAVQGFWVVHARDKAMGDLRVVGESLSCWRCEAWMRGGVKGGMVACANTYVGSLRLSMRGCSCSPHSNDSVFDCSVRHAWVGREGCALHCGTQ